MNINYQEEIRQSVKTEFEEFKQAQTAKSPQAVFSNSYQINFFNEIFSYFENNEDNEDILCALYKERGNIIMQLYDYHLDSEYGITNYGEISGLITDYIDKYHERDGENEMD